MTSNTLRQILIMLLVAIFAASPAIQLRAQDATPETISRMVTVQPADTDSGEYISIEVAAGTSGDFTIVVANDGNVNQHVRFYAVPAGTLDNGGFAAAPYGTEPDLVTSWLGMAEQTLELDAGKGQEVVVKVSVPDGTPAGEYVTSISAEQAEAFEIPGTDVMSQRVRWSMPVQIIVPGDFQYSFEFSSAELELRNHALIGVIEIVNTGTATVRPTGEVRLLDDNGNVIGVSGVEMRAVYSGTTANMYVGWQNVPTFESYSLEVTLTDPDNGATASATFNDLVPITEHVVEAAATPVPELAFSQADLAPLTDDVPPSMLSFEGAISNPADPIENARVSIVTHQDGEEVDRYPILQGVTLATGTTPLEARYALPGGFTDGTYTFAVTIELGSSGSQTVLVSQTIDFEVTVDD